MIGDGVPMAMHGNFTVLPSETVIFCGAVVKYGL
jgi:hypothetical protein